MIWSLVVSGAFAAEVTTAPGGILALSAALVAVVALILALRQAASGTAPRHATGAGPVATRDTGHGTLVIALTDPDAAVRPRPRAPSR